MTTNKPNNSTMITDEVIEEIYTNLRAKMSDLFLKGTKHERPITAHDQELTNKRIELLEKKLSRVYKFFGWSEEG